MGIIASVTPATSSSVPVPRLKTTCEDIRSLGRIDIHFYKLEHDFMSALAFEKLSDSTTEDSTWRLDMLSKVTWRYQPHQPGWSGMMQMLQQGTHQGVSTIAFLPMIDLNPSDLTCIYSTLKFVSGQARKYGVKPIITFDQPLYWKALTIICNESTESELKSVISHSDEFPWVHWSSDGWVWASRNLGDSLCTQCRHTHAHW